MFDYKKKKPMEDEMSSLEKEAKMGVLSSMKADAEKDMLGKLQGVKKVEVAADSPEALEMGLEKAKELVDQRSVIDGLQGELPKMSVDELRMLIDECQKVLDEKSLSAEE